MSNILEQLNERAAQKGKRIVHTFFVPEGLAKTFGVESIGIVELTAEEELIATRRARNEPIRLAFELAKESVRVINGAPISTGNGTADSFWQNVNPKIRSLIVQAYGEIHNPPDEATQSFLKSRQVEV